MTSERHKGKSGSELALLAIELTLSTAAKEFWSNPEFRDHMPVNRDTIWRWKNSFIANKEIYKCGTHLKNKKIKGKKRNERVLGSFFLLIQNIPNSDRLLENHTSTQSIWSI